MDITALTLLSKQQYKSQLFVATLVPPKINYLHPANDKAWQQLEKITKGDVLFSDPFSSIRCSSAHRPHGDMDTAIIRPVADSGHPRPINNGELDCSAMAPCHRGP